jgi:hypothetical protein
MKKQPLRTDLAGHLIQIALALYLMPVLLIVLAVGGVGLFVLAVGRLFTGSNAPGRQPIK